MIAVAGTRRVAGELAARQAALVAALVAGAAPPAGFDPALVSAARRALLVKRAGEVARAWPLLAASHGAVWPECFIEWAASRPPRGPQRDGRDFGSSRWAREQTPSSAGILPPMPDVNPEVAGPSPTAVGPAQSRPQGEHGRPGRRVSMASMLPGLFVDVALPIATYYGLEAWGVPTFWALLTSGVWPLGKSLSALIRQRRVDEFSAFILTLIVLGTLTSLLFRDARLLLLKDSAFTGILGIVYLATLLMKRPLMFYFGRKFATDGSAAGLARWDGFWTDLSVFRRGQRILTGVWGVALLSEALIRIPLTLLLPLNVMVGISNIMPFVVITALVFWTMRYGKRLGDRSRAQAAELAVGSR